MRVLVCGGREFNDAKLLVDVLETVHQVRPITLLIQGGARGADAMAKAWAECMGVPGHTEDARWELYGKRAGPVRNRKMLREQKPDLVVAFPGGTGTLDMILVAQDAGVETLYGWHPEDVVKLVQKLGASSTGNQR